MTANPRTCRPFAAGAAMLAILGLSGCAMAPKPLQGEFAPLTPDEARDVARTGERVRWGGEIVEVETRPDRTCFELLGKPLRDDARPRDADLSVGRFLACRQGFYDPALFEPGRDVTVTGVVEGFEQQPIGEYSYRYPRVAADVVYLWPERESVYYSRYRFGPAWPHYHPGFWAGYWRPYRFIVPRSAPQSAPPPKAAEVEVQ